MGYLDLTLPPIGINPDEYHLWGVHFSAKISIAR
jgi:hypothetical protein